MQLHGARSAQGDKHKTHSFTFDVIATALQVVVVHSRLVLFIAKLSLFLGFWGVLGQCALLIC